MRVRNPPTVVRQVFAVIPPNACAKHTVVEAVSRALSKRWIVRALTVRMLTNGHTEVSVERYLLQGEFPALGTMFSTSPGMWKKFQNEDDL